MRTRQRLHKLKHFNNWEFNCDECCLKNEHECPGDKEFCAIKYDHTVIREHRVHGNKYKGCNDDLFDEIDFSHGIPSETQATENNNFNRPIEPAELCGQGRCMECPHTLC